MNENKILSQKAMLGDLDGVLDCLNRGANAVAYNNAALKQSLIGNQFQITKLLLQKGASCRLVYEYAMEKNNIELLDYVMCDPELVASGRNISNILEGRTTIWSIIKSESYLNILQYLLTKLSPKEIEDNRMNIFTTVFNPRESGRIDTKNAHFLIDYLIPTDAELKIVAKEYERYARFYINVDITPLTDYVIASRERAQLSGVVGCVGAKKFKL